MVLDAFELAEPYSFALSAIVEKLGYMDVWALSLLCSGRDKQSGIAFVEPRLHLQHY